MIISQVSYRTNGPLVLLWVVGLNFYSKLCMVGADFFFFIGGGA